MPHAVYIIFLFALGACVGSFLNVVVYRLPKANNWWEGIKSLIHPPSHCPKCNKPLAWYDNIPVFGWIFLGGKCRSCKLPISPRYPIVEAICGGLFVFYYVMFFIYDIGPCLPVSDQTWGVVVANDLVIERHWPIYALYIFTIAALLAASLIDAELFIIPLEIPWLVAIVGLIAHAFIAPTGMPGNLAAGPIASAVGAGGTVGLILSMLALRFGWLKRSFPQGEPVLDVDREAIQQEIEQLRKEGKPVPELPPPYTSGQIRAEMGREMLFLLPPMLLAGVMVYLVREGGPLAAWWQGIIETKWLAGALGALCGGLVGGFVVWLTRILGTLAFGRVAMGLGDVHLMFGVGAVIGGGAATVAFFIAPFFGLVLAVWMLLTGKRRELPYGPYLSLGTAAVMLLYCPIERYLRDGIDGLMYLVGGGS